MARVESLLVEALDAVYVYDKRGRLAAQVKMKTRKGENGSRWDFGDLPSRFLVFEDEDEDEDDDMNSDSPLLPLAPTDALLIVDAQNDFLAGGSLAVPRGDEVIPVLNRYIARFEERRLPIFATRDWHPPNHCSFQTQAGLWPIHCVMHTRGAEFSPALKLPSSATVISKGSAPDKEAYSGFEGTDLEKKLRHAGIERLYAGGLATDFCVLNTVRDALRRGFKVCLLRDAVRAVNVQRDGGRRAEEEMLRVGAMPFELADQLIEQTR